MLMTWLAYLRHSRAYNESSKQSTSPKTRPQIEHQARPRQALDTAPLRSGTDMCKIRASACTCARAKTDLESGQSNHEQTEGQTGRRRPPLPPRTGRDGSTPRMPQQACIRNCRYDATRVNHCNFMRQGGGRPRAAAGSRRNVVG